MIKEKKDYSARDNVTAITEGKESFKLINEKLDLILSNQAQILKLVGGAK